MRLIGSLLMGVGAFCLLAAVLAIFGPTMRTNGIDIFANVTSVKGVAASGVLLLVLGAAMRRRKVEERASTGNSERGTGNGG